MENKCNHKKGWTGEIIFGKIVNVDTERVEIEYKERCDSCGKTVNTGTFIYRRKD